MEPSPDPYATDRSTPVSPLATPVRYPEGRKEREARIWRAGIDASVALGLPIIADPNPFPRLRLFRRSAK